MTAVRTRAVVLRRTNYGEADRIVQLLTPVGKKSVVARGVRREKSKLAGGIELFAVSDVVINEGKGELGIVTSARLVDFYRHILEDYDTMQFGYEAIKQVGRAVEAVDEPEWFDLIVEVLQALNTPALSRQLIQTWFYLRYAALMGHELSLSHDVQGDRLQADATYRYDIGEKGLRMDEHGDLSADHVKYLRLLGAKPLMTVAQVGGVERVLPECWFVARQHAAL
ncbi:DNA repair protein RecO [Streptomyces caniscabiei]|uniref:DNA repair protein RecO n=1 Tax=Streptomyces caniscabiei TaxID=2746961 RepID=UPI0029ACA76C|nr:DNA repair protein RecO [Streptomyces caniscabiei]MDX2776188.1 DNA repair protein RecO [Streptomyces caniscabiei]